MKTQQPTPHKTLTSTMRGLNAQMEAEYEAYVIRNNQPRVIYVTQPAQQVIKNSFGFNVSRGVVLAGAILALAYVIAQIL